MPYNNYLIEFIIANTSTHTSATNSAIYSIELVDEDLVKISCHIPPWNSTDWVTYELPLTVKGLETENILLNFSEYLSISKNYIF